MLLQDYRPRPMLTRTHAIVERPRFAVIDAHNHLGAGFGGWDTRPVAHLLEVLDSVGVHKYVDLDGGWGEAILDRHLAHFKAAAPDRFAIFGGVDWTQWATHGDAFGSWAAQRLRAQVRRGAQGLKIWKPLGLTVTDQHGTLVAVDDHRLDPLWATAGELDVPVLLHVADPVAFFEPLDATNERWEELHAHPDWQFPSPPFPPFRAIVDGLAAVVARHPATDFIGAHVGCYAENLGWVGALLDRCPNFAVDISARIAELGRQPYAARRFFIQYADRILFGTDAGPSVTTYQTYYRFLETADEYFNYAGDDQPHQGRWAIYGLYLPDEVLAKVYYGNAQRLIFARGRSDHDAGLVPTA